MSDAHVKTLGERQAFPPLLSVDGIKVHYGAIQALKGVSLTVGKGEVVALIGANGAGKTSTLRAVSGMLKPSAGRIQFNGHETTSMKAHQLVPRGMAHAPEGRGVFPNMSVQENLELGAYLRKDTAGIQADLEKSFTLFPVLKERRKQMAGTLSGGEQQMLAIARALLSKPQLLLLDEPSLGLAPQVTEAIFRTLREVNATGVSVLLVEQNAHLALNAAHYGYVLETGEVVMAGPGKALLESAEVRRAYLGE
ncbi:Branched-chain amino acid transport ATP-binding protein LivF [Myxococcus hansupus]|uniref:Branched-chain amino acid transport ATP-binding protein LivF n=1 Tax=Pseudomyxococcus hansupus TaxID=1297742 RepID=A0A0H4WKR0_9BACT|nr:ABC transporter ATP-binding protein [Myxococcus hansupus]AKQ63314.1 Branched-chain amino acid transport ATP-binding protein LivF [Myxococcus hansupus]